MEATAQAGIRGLTALMEWLDRHPRLVARLLRPLANAPLLSPHLMVLVRACMGATAFEIHDIDRDRGRIGIGGVEEILFGSKVVHLLHTTLDQRLGDVEAKRALYELGVNLCTWEVSQALAGGKWAPAVLVPLIHHAGILREVQGNPVMRRFFGNVVDRMSRLITDEGGWGHLEFDLSMTPMRVLLSHSQEAAWLGPSDRPVCHLYAGIVAGYTSTLSGERLNAREVACAAMGAPKCVFEVVR